MVDLVKRLRDAGDDYTVAWGSGELYDEAADELERLTRELEEARKDAERYRWARSLEHCNKVWCFIGAGEAAGNLDAAIDAAMSQEKRKDALDRMARDADELGLDF